MEVPVTKETKKDRVRDTIKHTVTGMVADLVFGAIAALIVVVVIQKIAIPFIYELFVNSADITGVMKSAFSLQEVIEGKGLGICPFLIRTLDKPHFFEAFALLYGARFVVHYVTGITK